VYVHNWTEIYLKVFKKTKQNEPIYLSPCSNNMCVCKKTSLSYKTYTIILYRQLDKFHKIKVLNEIIKHYHFKIYIYNNRTNVFERNTNKNKVIKSAYNVNVYYYIFI